MKYHEKEINNWLAKYHKDLSMNSQGVCYLTVSKTLTVVISLSSDKQFLMLYCPVHPISGAEDMPLALAALSLNLYQDIATQGTIGYDEQAQKLAYMFVISQQTSSGRELNEDQFHRILNDFISASQSLVERFDHIRVSQSEPSSRAKTAVSVGLSQPVITEK